MGERRGSSNKQLQTSSRFHELFTFGFSECAKENAERDTQRGREEFAQTLTSFSNCFSLHFIALGKIDSTHTEHTQTQKLENEEGRAACMCGRIYLALGLETKRVRQGERVEKMC